MDTLTGTALAEAIVADGFDAHRSALAVLLNRAHQCQVNEVLLSILSDDTTPRVARERALGRVLVFMQYRRRKALEDHEDLWAPRGPNRSRPVRTTHQVGEGSTERPSDQSDREQTELALCR